MGRCRDERGMATVELVLMTPVLFLVLSFLVVAGRLTTVRGDVAAAASPRRARSATQIRKREREREWRHSRS